MKKSKEGAGRKASGNITVDLGEAIDKKLRAALGEGKKPEKAKMAGFGEHRPLFGSRFGRPVLGNRFGRPSLGWRPFGAPSLGAQGGSMLKGLQRSAGVVELLGGAGIGVVANRALMRVTPGLIKNDNEMLHSGIAFVVGLVPALVRQNSMTLGVAVPGAVYLAGSLVDAALNAVGIAKPSLRGSSNSGGGIDQAMAARQRLADIQARLAPQRSVSGTQAPQRAYAQAAR